MALPFRQRIFVVLVALTAVPTALAVVGWALAVRTVGPSAGARVALEEMAASARQMVDRMDTTHLAPRERAAVREHLERLSNSVTLARRAETYLRYYAGGFALVVIVFGGLALTTAVRLARHLSRQLSRPIDELVGWTRLIRRASRCPGVRRAVGRLSLRRCARRCASSRRRSTRRASASSRPSGCGHSGRWPAAWPTRSRTRSHRCGSRWTTSDGRPDRRTAGPRRP